MFPVMDGKRHGDICENCANSLRVFAELAADDSGDAYDD